MNGNDLLSALGHVEDRFVDEAAHKTLPGAARPLKAFSAAACLCLMLLGLFGSKIGANRQAADSAVNQWTGNSAMEGIYGNAVPEDAGCDSAVREIQEPGAPLPEAQSTAAAPAMLLRVLEVTDTGFVGVLEDGTGLPFAAGAQLTVTVERKGEYEAGSLVRVYFTDWNVQDRTVTASAVEIREENE